MDRKKLLIALGIGAVAIALVAGALATRGPAATSPDGGTQSTDASATGAASSADTTPTPGGSPGAIGSEAPVQDRTLDPEAITKTPTAGGEPAAAGSELETVTIPPAQTLAFIAETRGSSGDTFRVSFRPYGLGPVRPEGPTLVVRMDSASRSSSNESSLLIANGTNAIVLASPSQLDAVSRGGTYAGTIELVPSGGALALRLTDASRVGQ